jgi:hypothetical protein
VLKLLEGWAYVLNLFLLNRSIHRALPKRTELVRRFSMVAALDKRKRGAILALQLPFLQVSESMGNHDSKIVDAGGVD